MNILLVATASFAGMGPYAAQIINSFNNEENIFFFLVEDNNKFYSQNIALDIYDKALILERKNNKLNKLTSLFFSPCKIVKKLHEYCKEKEIDAIHFLTSETAYSHEIIALSKKYKVFYTVHDLHPHEADKIFYKMWRHNIAYKKVSEIINKTQNLITNSEQQYHELKTRFINKNIFFHEFPSLISKSVSEGKMIPKEIENKKNYILFFGRIEQYKGIEYLYNVFISTPPLNQKMKLVIAGSGDIYFTRNLDKEENVIFINRYIQDEEITFLYKNARCVVYPYISASQSGVLSLSCYYQKATLTSNIPYFNHVFKNGIGYTFQNKDSEDLKIKLLKILSINKEDMQIMQEKQKFYYLKYYDKNSIKDNLLKIYNTIL